MAVLGWDRIFGECPACGYVADLVCGVFGEPEFAVGADGDSKGITSGRRDRVFGERAARRRDPPDIVPVVFREPEGTVRTQRNAGGFTSRRQDRIYGDIAGGGDSSDFPAAFREP